MGRNSMRVEPVLREMVQTDGVEGVSRRRLLAGLGFR